MKHRISNNKGFTIIELMVATAVFSVILLIVTAGVMAFTRQYIKGQTNNKTQVTVRNIINQITADAEFNSYHSFNGSYIPADGDGDVGCFQIGNDLYSYELGAEVVEDGSGNHQASDGLVVAPATDQDCSSPSTPGDPLSPDEAISLSGARELLGQNMRLMALNISQTNGIYSVEVKVAYGDDDLLGITDEGDPDSGWDSITCTGNSGDQFCSVVDLQTTVAARL